METTDYLPADAARVFNWAWAPILADFRHPRTPDSLAMVTANVYRRLPSGDYGRGDVRAAILAVWGFDLDSWAVECERLAKTDASAEEIISDLIDGSYDATWYPGRTGTEREGTDTPVIAADWNQVPDADRIERALEDRGIDIDWGDGVSGCSDCNRAVTTHPEHWCWTPSYAWEGDCTIVCHACCGSRGLRWTEDGRGFRTVDPEDWRDRSISSGTMRPEDTVPAMVSALRELGYSGGEWRRAHEEFRTIEDTETRLVSAVLNGDNTGDPDDTGESVAWLADLLSEVAPEGCYFGAHPDDGACFGFWPWPLEAWEVVE